MSKIICDVCGTSYPETATQCPICGCVRPGDAHIVSGDTNDTEAGATGNYNYVKGGRFSKTNVKKRNRTGQPVPVKSVSELTGDKNSKAKADTGLIIAIAAFLLAIIAVVIYIAVRFLAPGASDDATDATEQNQTQAQTQTENIDQTTTVSQEDDTPCTGINVKTDTVSFDKVNAARLLEIDLTPVDTTDELIFASTNPDVATVDSNGKVVSVGPGEAIITITCGQQVKECKVICEFEVESTEPSTETTEPVEPDTDPEPSDGTLKLDYHYQYPNDPLIGDARIHVGEKWVAYLDGEGKIKSSQINFTSSNENVVTIDQYGIVRGVAEGEAFITAEYNGQTDKCRVIVAKK